MRGPMIPSQSLHLPWWETRWRPLSSLSVCFFCFPQMIHRSPRSGGSPLPEPRFFFPSPRPRSCRARALPRLRCSDGGTGTERQQPQQVLSRGLGRALIRRLPMRLLCLALLGSVLALPAAAAKTKLRCRPLSCAGTRSRRRTDRTRRDTITAHPTHLSAEKRDSQNLEADFAGAETPASNFPIFLSSTTWTETSF